MRCALGSNFVEQMKSRCLLDLADSASLGAELWRYEAVEKSVKFGSSEKFWSSELPSALYRSRAFRAFRAFSDSDSSPTYYQHITCRVSAFACRTFQELHGIPCYRGKTSQPASQPCPPVTPFFIFGLLWSTAKAWFACDVFEHVER